LYYTSSGDTQPDDFLAKEFELIWALPEISQQCRNALKAKCDEEFIQKALHQVQCWGCDPTTGFWMGAFVAWSVLTGLEGELP
jgi:hypothetical protein